MSWAMPAAVGVREIENDWIVMPGGVRLAVSLWLPETDAPVPVVLEAIPYRKRDATRAYGRFWGRKLAERGVAYARLDARGSGDSDGLLLDEYLPQEQADCADAIAWLAAQPWCNGAVGMRGVSWGGFITLQTAALAPPALKAIMPMCASDRRFTDDAHYIGGAFALTGLKWATSMQSVMAGPPDPAIFGEGWEAAWMMRLEAAPAIAARWLSHQREDDYWRQGSVGLHAERIVCPTYLVGGWADPYNNSIPRLLSALKVPTKALIGPWQHGYPQPATPGPGLDWIGEEVRWWRHWLAGEATGVMEGPQLWAYMPEASPAQAPTNIPGRWIAEAAWPPITTTLILRLAPGRLGDIASDAVLELHSDALVGLQTPEWCPFSPTQFPQEQSPDDAGSFTFDSEPLTQPLELLGHPTLHVRLAATKPVAKLAARLTEVTQDGHSWLMSYGVLNLTHRTSHEAPEALTPGAAYDITLPLYLTARRLRPGSRLRLALSESLWPLMWPSPEPVTLRLDLAGALLTLPVRAPTADLPFPIPILEAPPPSPRSEPEIVHDRAFREAWLPSTATLDTGTTIERSGGNVEANRDPAGGRWRAWQTGRYRREDWDCTVEVEVELTADVTRFHLRERLTAKRGDAVVFEREEAKTILRDLM
jgi:predicted acyl esterase